jgi:glycosyltransferase involved in cell wall biosynthesis
VTAVTLSIVIPARDEKENLPILLSEIAELVPQLPQLMEVIVVDDGSRDGSSGVLDELASELEWLRVIHFAENRGQTVALAAGIDAAEGDLIATLDADLQNDPADIPRLIRVLERSSADMVTGVRQHRRDSLWKRIQSRVGNQVRNWITGDHLVDTGCTLRVSRREIVAGLLDFDGAHRFVPTLARIRGGLVVEEPVNHRPRRFGSSKYGAWSRAIGGLARCFHVRRLRRRALR